MTANSRTVDVLIIGAGLAGIGAACRLRQARPDTSFVVLERRKRIGGTWDLFRYPGIRTDSDVFTYGYEFEPWKDTKTLVGGADIRRYIEDTAAKHGISDHIRFGRKVVRASWSSDTARWTVETTNEDTGLAETYTARFLIGATGYYDYDAGYRPSFPGEEGFGGTFVHPQHWPEDLDFTGKRVVVIGSGATAITLVPAMVDTAAHVTMLQRSPTYVVSLPNTDSVAATLRRLRVPLAVTHRLSRARFYAQQRLFYQLCKAQPSAAKALLLGLVRANLGSRTDMRHFTPTYKPWDQRVCIVPDGDLFKAIKSGRADIVTDTIDTFTETGIRLASGAELEADIVVTATGLNMKMLGGVDVTVDERPFVIRESVIYKGTLLSDLPNAMFLTGYTNASWTLKTDIASQYFCRLLDYMDRNGHEQFVVRAEAGDIAEEAFLVGGGLASGYLQRGDATMPRQGTRRPWQYLNDYVRDAQLLRYGVIDDSVLQFDTQPTHVTLVSSKGRAQPDTLTCQLAGSGA